MFPVSTVDCLRLKSAGYPELFVSIDKTHPWADLACKPHKSGAVPRWTRSSYSCPWWAMRNPSPWDIYSRYIDISANTPLTADPGWSFIVCYLVLLKAVHYALTGSCLECLYMVNESGEVWRLLGHDYWFYTFEKPSWMH